MVTETKIERALTPKTIAYCDRHGVIGFSQSGKLPAGMLPIAAAADAPLRKLISARARLGYDNATLIVPGVPEADNGLDAVEALDRFSAEIEADIENGAGE